MLLVLLIALVPGLLGFSQLVGDEVARVRLSYVLPGDDVAAVTPLIAEVSAGGVPVVALVAVALTCASVVRFVGLDLNGALAAVAGTILVELMLALSFRGFGGAEELVTLVAPMVAAAVLVPLVTAAAFRLKDEPPERAQLGGPRRVAILAVLMGMLLVVVFVDVSWHPWLTALPAVVAWFLFKPAAVPTNERALRAFVIGGALLIFAVALVAREHMWDGRVLVAVIVLGLATLWLARTPGAWAPRALVVGVAAVGVGALAAVAAAHEDPTPVRAVVVLTDDRALTCGIHIANVGGKRAYVEIGGGQRKVKLVARDELLAYERADASADAWRSVARRLAVSVIQDRKIRRATTPGEFCQPDRPPAPKASEGLTIAQRYQPDLNLPRDDGFWPVSVITAFGLRDRGRGTCIEARGPTIGCGLDDGLPWSGGANRWLEYPSNERETSRQERAMKAVLGSDDPERSALQYFLVSRGEADTWNVQYWSYYVFNYQDDTLGGYHEGDFELAGLVLSASGRPRYVWMSRHESYEGRPFAFDEPVFQGDNHIDLHIARGSHAAYDTCERQPRPGLFPPDDHPACGERSYRLRPQLSDLALAPWACWQGRFGHRSSGGSPGRKALGAGPFSPLWQQEFDGRRAQPCKEVPEDPGGAPFLDEANPDAAARTLRDAAGRLEWLFDECSDWEKPPSAGTYLVACDETALRDYFASGLDDSSSARVRITGVGRDPEPTVPAVWRTPRSVSLERPVITAPAGSWLRVYAVCDDMSGGRVEVTFRSVRVSGGGSARIDDSDPALWQLRGTDGRLLAADHPNRLSYEEDGHPRPGPAVSARCRR